jgi:hypothetical protein
MEDLAAAGLGELVVSMSGWTQDTSILTHPGVDVSRVKRLMLDAVQAGVRKVTLYWHRYRNNLEEEWEARRFSRERGLRFAATWAYPTVIEDVLNGREFPHMVLSSARLASIVGRKPDGECWIAQRGVALFRGGGIRLCPVAATQQTIGNVFEDSLDEAQAIRSIHPLCKRCLAVGVSKTACGLPLSASLACARSVPFKARHWLDLLRQAAWELKEGRL